MNQNALVIRAPELNDRDDLVALLTSTNVRQFLGGPLPADAAKTQALKTISESYGTYYLVEVSGCFAGLISVTKHIEENGTEISYQFLSDYVGKGIAFAAIKEVLNEIPKPVIAETQVQNIRSCNLLERLGFLAKRRVMRYGAEQVVAILE